MVLVIEDIVEASKVLDMPIDRLFFAEAPANSKPASIETSIEAVAEPVLVLADSFYQPCVTVKVVAAPM